jgi:TolB protein
MEPTNETPAVGFVRVIAATVGLGLDSDGYTVTLDPGGASLAQPVTANGTVDFGGIPNGDHTFVIEGVADNCALNGDATQPVTVVGGKIQPLPVMATCTAAPLTGPNLIAFDSDRDGFSEIYTMRPDGSQQTRVTQDELINVRPSFAPDGSSIAFEDADAGEVNVVGPDGSGETDLTLSDDVESEPAFSPDASRIAFLINAALGGGVSVMNADGTDVRALFRGPTAGKPAWSPDGQQIAFESDSAIVTMSAAGGTPAPVVPAESHNPAWGPDGRIAFDSPSQPDGPGIFVRSADGTTTTRVTTGDDHTPTWSPDGSKIAFTRGAEDTEDQEIFVVNADGSGLVQLTNNEFADSHPSWSH